ncbi:MAG TPA: symmetrical bis(5'-nucleosyl)-tetraphosphatase [Steroidobacteraceae bacterium]|nr:symmetrical bis(5'-nucleosyl)-tetraphosphatase [Steroidobacteraceae bacterium]
MAIYAIGDIQGCYDEFKLLLDKLQFDPAHDQLWLTGDLVNRGPHSLAVLRFVKSLGNSVITVLGNHDLHLLAVSMGTETKRKQGDTFDDILASPDRDELLHWLRQQPLLHHDPSLKQTLIHAGLPPQWTLAQAMSCAHEVESTLRGERTARKLFEHMYGNEPDTWDESLEGWARLRFITNCLTRLRVCTGDGTLKLKFKESPSTLKDNLYPWFKVPGRRTCNDHIIFGHWSALGFYEGDNVLALDTGCVWGGTLCAVRLDKAAPRVEIKSIDGGLPLEE